MENQMTIYQRRTGENTPSTEINFSDTRTNNIELLCDLELKQLKLKMQNDELRSVGAELQLLYEFYRSLYEHAPVGYIILRADDKVVLKANMTASVLLKAKRIHLVNTNFTKYIDPEFTDSFYLHCKKALESLKKESCDIKMRREDGSAFWALLELSVLEEKQRLCVAMMDITSQKESEARLENDRKLLESRVEEGIKKNQQLASQLLLVQEEERRKLGFELHDNAGQSLTLLIMSVNRIRKLPPQEIGPVIDEIEALAREITQNIRDVSRALTMQMLEEVGLLQALQTHFQKVQACATVNVNFRHQGLQQRLPRAIEITLFHIIQEAITNVVRHSRTDRVDVSLEVVNRILRLRIEDRGAGFEPASIGLNSPGIRGMQERAALLGGRIEIESSPGKGTRITGEFQLP